MNQNYASPYSQHSHPDRKPSKIKPLHLILTGVTAFILGIIAMIIFALLFPLDDDKEGVGGGDSAAVRYLDSRGIQIEQETYSKVAKVICDGFEGGSNGSDLKPIVSQTIGTGMVDSSEIVAASAVYSCPEYIGDLAR